jgi:hypothetical protein
MSQYICENSTNGMLTLRTSYRVIIQFCQLGCLIHFWGVCNYNSEPVTVAAESEA